MCCTVYIAIYCPFPIPYYVVWVLAKFTQPTAKLPFRVFGCIITEWDGQWSKSQLKASLYRCKNTNFIRMCAVSMFFLKSYSGSLSILNILLFYGSFLVFFCNSHHAYNNTLSTRRSFHVNDIRMADVHRFAWLGSANLQNRINHVIRYIAIHHSDKWIWPWDIYY